MIYVVLGLALAIGLSLITYSLMTPGVQSLSSLLGGTLAGFSLTFMIMDLLFG